MYSLRTDILFATIYLINQAKARGVEEMRDKMFSGEKINITEVKKMLDCGVLVFCNGNYFCSRICFCL